MAEGKILVLGTPGLVGSRFVDIYSRNYNLLTPTINELDITDKGVLDKYFNRNKISTVINFAAYTDVGEAEKQRGDKAGLCWEVNVEGVRNLANAADINDTYLIHISTDMVFSGIQADPGPYSEDNKIEEDEQKLTWYGFTKAQGEQMISDKLKDKATILRLIYPVRSDYNLKLDYLRKPLKLFDEGKLYPLFTDQQISITFIDEACHAIQMLLESHRYGIFHASSSDTTTPYEIVSYLIEKARGKKSAVKVISLDEFLKKVDNPVRYPKFGGLKVELTEKRLGIKYSLWRGIVDKLIKQGIKY